MRFLQLWHIEGAQSFIMKNLDGLYNYTFNTPEAEWVCDNVLQISL